MSDLETTVRLMGDLVAFPTVSSDSNRALIDWAAERLEDAGARVNVLASEEDGKANLFATLGPDIDGGIVLSGHTDVVPAEENDWHSDPFTMRLEDDRAYGRGTCDMKGFVAAAIAMAPAFAQTKLKRPIHFAFTHDEETGCHGAATLIEWLAVQTLKPSIAIVGEPTLMQIVTGHKGCYDYVVRFSGREGHASNPANGVNAVEAALRYGSRVLELAEMLRERAPASSPFDPPQTTLQVNRLAGGSAGNIIAGQCLLEWEMRPVTASDLAFVMDEIAALEAGIAADMRAQHPAARIERDAMSEVAGLEPMADDPARELLARLTGANGTETVAFGTEAGLFQSAGLSAVVCGPGSIAQAHKSNEFIALEQLSKALDLLHALRRDMANGASAPSVPVHRAGLN